MTKSLVRIRAEGSTLRATSLILLADVVLYVAEPFLSSFDAVTSPFEGDRISVEQHILGLEWPRVKGDDFSIASHDNVQRLNRYLFAVMNAMTEWDCASYGVSVNDGRYDRSDECRMGGQELVYVYATRVVLEYQSALMSAYTGCHRGSFGKYIISRAKHDTTLIAEYTEQVLETWKQFRVLPYHVNDGQPEVGLA